LTPPARLPRDVPEKAEAFLREALLPASDELRSFVAMITWLAAPDQRKASFFQTHHGAGTRGWRVVAHNESQLTRQLWHSTINDFPK
jgi:hypothetical protein